MACSLGFKMLDWPLGFKMLPSIGVEAFKRHVSWDMVIRRGAVVEVRLDGCWGGGVAYSLYRELAWPVVV